MSAISDDRIEVINERRVTSSAPSSSSPVPADRRRSSRMSGEGQVWGVEGFEESSADGPLFRHGPPLSSLHSRGGGEAGRAGGGMGGGTELYLSDDGLLVRENI